MHRAFPEHPRFQDEQVKSTLESALFIWSKMNPNISYRQGMHELAAIIFIVIEKDSINNIDDQEFEILLDSRYVEADTFILFFSLMRCTKAWYESTPSSRPPQGTPSLPILKICEKVMYEYLKPLDYPLFSHLTKLQIEPQLFGL